MKEWLKAACVGETYDSSWRMLIAQPQGILRYLGMPLGLSNSLKRISGLVCLVSRPDFLLLCKRQRLGLSVSLSVSHMLIIVQISQESLPAENVEWLGRP